MSVRSQTSTGSYSFPGFAPGGPTDPIWKDQVPGPGTKERKYVLHGRFGPFEWLVSGFFDGRDILVAANDCLSPDSRLYGSRNPWFLAENLYKNINDLDIGCLMSKLAAMEVEDWIIGRIGQLSKDATRASGRMAGYQLGDGFGRRYVIGGVGR